eukprot:TRINITY_DN11979_c0_g1_i1.p1 TRINITY_DN11979_c0_g1~~TRINITY_DN11979_c0_g1_i1.p1  ORF type:complete len:527 (-),score=95.58 TRINITY_DN11979_c0_g1_i1:261-1841(-)
MKSFFTVCILLSLLAAFNGQQFTNMLEAATSNNFTILVQALEAVSLTPVFEDPDFEATVFAPTNEAFSQLLTILNLSLEELLNNTETLSQVLLYHVVDVVALAEDLSDGQELQTLLENGTLFVNLEDGVVIEGVGSSATVVVPNIEAGTGVIHVVDQVLLPFSLEDEEDVVDEEDTIVSVASSVDDLSLLVEAVAAADLVDALNDPLSAYTVFAPTNAAFVDLLDTLGVTKEELFANTELLSAVLTYHVVPAVAKAKDLGNEQVLDTLNDEATLQVLIEGDVISINAVGSIAQVVTADIPAGSSVVHVIDTVLLPITLGQEDEPGEDQEEEEESIESVASVASQIPELSTLVEALIAADLVDILSDGAAPLTVFAPTNAAFEATLMDLEMTLEDLIAEPGLLDEILLYHVVEGTYFSNDLFDGLELTTLSMERELIVSIEDPTVKIEGIGSTAEVTEANIPAGEAVIHVVDNVLLPFEMVHLEQEIIETEEPGFFEILLEPVISFFEGVGIFLGCVFTLGLSDSCK